MTKQKSEKKTKSEKGRSGKKKFWNFFWKQCQGKFFLREIFFEKFFF